MMDKDQEIQALKRQLNESQYKERLLKEQIKRSKKKDDYEWECEWPLGGIISAVLTFIIIILVLGEPDLLDAAIKWAMRE